MGFDLLTRLLRMDPKARITATEALTHVWFSEPPLATSLDMMPRIRSREQELELEEEENESGIVGEEG